MAEKSNPDSQFQYNKRSNDFCSAEQLIRRACDGTDYGRGQIEANEAGLEQTRDALARLTQILFDQGVLSVDDVYSIAGM